MLYVKIYYIDKNNQLWLWRYAGYDGCFPKQVQKVMNLPMKNRESTLPDEQDYLLTLLNFFWRAG